MADFYSNSIFWVETDKIRPNPYQPRREFEEGALKDLAESIRLYGIMQPLTVSRVEREKPEGGIAVEYELIAGERRMRASKLAGLKQVPVIIRVGDTSQEKLELAIIENLQRADLNPVERAHAFARLAAEFKLQHGDIGKKMGRSREYVSNTLRILALPQEMLDALASGRITEGHTRPLLMLTDRPDEQMVLFKEIMNKKVTVREAERAARNIATERARKAPRQTDPILREIEASLQKMLGERVHVEQDAIGGRVTISFLNPDELKTIMAQLRTEKATSPVASAPIVAAAPIFEPVHPVFKPVPQPMRPAYVPASTPVSVPVAAPIVKAAAPFVPAPMPMPTPEPVSPVVETLVSVPEEKPVVIALENIAAPVEQATAVEPIAAPESAIEIPVPMPEAAPVTVVVARSVVMVEVPQVAVPVAVIAVKEELAAAPVAPAVLISVPVAAPIAVAAPDMVAPVAAVEMPVSVPPIPQPMPTAKPEPSMDDSDLYSLNMFSL